MKWLNYGISFTPFFAPDNGGENGGGGNQNSSNGNGSNSGEGGSNSSGDKNGNSGGNNANQGEDKKFTQADIDKAVNDRLAREKRKHEKAIEELKKTVAGDSEATNNGASQGAEGQQGDNGSAAVAQALAAANQRLVQATAIAEAVKLGVDPKYTGDVVKLADLSKIEIKDDGTMDTSAIDKAIDEVLKRVPVFKMTTDNVGGFKIGGQGGSNTPDANGWKNTANGQNAGFKPWNKTNRF